LWAYCVTRGVVTNPTGWTVGSIFSNNLVTIKAAPTTGAYSEAFSVSDTSALFLLTFRPAIADTIPPTVFVTAPVNGAVLSGVVTLLATAADNVGVATLQFTVDGNPIGAPALNVGLLSYPLDTASLSTGTHVIGARATDAAGNIGIAPSVNVTVLHPISFSAVLLNTSGTPVQGIVKLSKVIGTAAPIEVYAAPIALDGSISYSFVLELTATYLVKLYAVDGITQLYSFSLSAAVLDALHLSGVKVEPKFDANFKVLSLRLTGDFVF